MGGRLLHKDTNPDHKDSTLVTSSPPQSSTPKYHHSGIRISLMVMGRTPTFRPQRLKKVRIIYEWWDILVAV